MTVANYWNGSAFVPISGIVGPQGPPGPLGSPVAPTGPAGGHLMGTYPNPAVNPEKVGGLIDVRSMWGATAAYRAIASGQKFYTNNGATPIQLTYTPTVACWWETQFQVGLMEKTDAVYHSAFWHIKLTPSDADGKSDAWTWAIQNSGVSRYGFIDICRTWRLSAGVAYTAYSWFDQLVVAGSWQYYQSSTYLSMVGRAWAL